MDQSNKNIFQFIFLTIVAIMITVQASFLLKTNFHVSKEDACHLVRSGEISYHVAIVWEETPSNSLKNYVCSGTLISEKYVLTLAECVEETVRDNTYKTRLKVVVDTRTIPGGTPCDVEKITYHPSYNKETHTDNIALIQLKENRKFHNFLYSISLPDKKIKIEEGLELFVSGFDMHHRRWRADLHKFSMHVVSIERCQKYLKRQSQLNFTGKFCAIGQYSYFSEMRSPAANVNKDYIIGIYLSETDYFGPNKKPELFIDVTSYLFRLYQVSYVTA